MEQELTVDEGSLTKAAQGIREAAEVLEQSTDALLGGITSGRSPWGDGVIGLLMDQVNEMSSEACRHLSSNLDRTGVCLEAMRDLHAAGERVSAAAIQAVLSGVGQHATGAQGGDR